MTYHTTTSVDLLLHATCTGTIIAEEREPKPVFSLHWPLTLFFLLSFAIQAGFGGRDSFLSGFVGGGSAPFASTLSSGTTERARPPTHHQAPAQGYLL